MVFVMGHRVVGDHVPLVKNRLRCRRLSLRIVTYHEENGLDAMRLQRRQNLGCVRLVRAIVERQPERFHWRRHRSPFDSYAANMSDRLPFRNQRVCPELGAETENERKNSRAA